jgi:outer membrane protein OmpA-like peptidoglycan-associated protein
MTKSRWLVFFLLISSLPVFADDIIVEPAANTNRLNSFDTTGRSNKDTTVIRFDYKQSALFHAFTFTAIDSVVAILLKNKEVTLSIDGYAYKDEGSDTICYYLSLNRALFVQTYVLGRGIDSARIIALNAWGNRRQLYKNKDGEGLTVNCRAEILLNYPPPPVKPVIPDRDEDGIVDTEDKCPDEFGFTDNGGCPNKDVVIVPFETQESGLYWQTYQVLDSVIAVLKENPLYSISIEGHAYKTEGINSVCNGLAADRAAIVKNYLISRQLNSSRINALKNYSNRRPLNAGKNPKDISANSRAEIVFTKE